MTPEPWGELVFEEGVTNHVVKLLSSEVNERIRHVAREDLGPGIKQLPASPLAQNGRAGAGAPSRRLARAATPAAARQLTANAAATVAQRRDLLCWRGLPGVVCAADGSFSVQTRELLGSGAVMCNMFYTHQRHRIQASSRAQGGACGSSSGSRKGNGDQGGEGEGGRPSVNKGSNKALARMISGAVSLTVVGQGCVMSELCEFKGGEPGSGSHSPCTQPFKSHPQFVLK